MVNLTAQATKILSQAGYDSHGQEISVNRFRKLRSKVKRRNSKPKTKKEPWRNFEAIPYADWKHMQSIKQESRSA